MNFSGFLGNDQLKKDLSTAFQKGQLSHCYLLSGPRGAGKKTLATILAAAMECTGTGEKPCRICSGCHKVFSGAHPDVVWVDEPGKAILPVETIRKVRADAFIRPNEGAKKIYLFPHGETLNPSGQNALLKLIEEPPAYGVFILMTQQPQVLLPTVRSRCVELHLSPLTSMEMEAELQRRFPDVPAAKRQEAAVESQGILGHALEMLTDGDAISPLDIKFLEAFSQRDDLALLEVFLSLEKLGREPFLATLQRWQAFFHEALRLRSGMASPSPQAKLLGEHRTSRELLQAYDCLQTAITYGRGNVGIGHLCGALAIQLKN